MSRNRSCGYGLCAAKAKKDRITIAASMRRTAREVLNELRWREPGRLSDAVLWYIDRVHPEGYRQMRGSEIVDLERRYFTTSRARLPYSKIVWIECGEEVLYTRRVAR